MVFMGRLLNPDFVPPNPRERPVAPPYSAVPIPRSRFSPAAAVLPAATLQATPGLKPTAAPAEANVQYQDNNPFRKLAFNFGMAMVTVIFAALSELSFYISHGTNFYLLYLVTPPAVLGVLICGAIKRTFQHRAAWYWMAFFGWMVIAVPFSTWRGASLGRVIDYTRVNLPIMFIVAGLPTVWKEIRTVFYTLAASGIISLFAARLFGVEENGRLTLESSTTIGNSNDLAAHLITLLPFVLFVVMDRKRNFFLRFGIIVPLIFYGIWIILGTASRGAVMAMGAMFLFAMWRATPARRLIVVVLVVLTALALPALMPSSARARLMTLAGGQYEEAKESKESRSYLFHQSIVYTLQHPIVGVGPDQFPIYEGEQSVAQGKLGNWHATHCAFTQVSSECGIPALIFFMLGIGSALFAVNKVYSQARKQGYQDVANACFCYLIAMVGLVVADIFLSNAYRFYLPCMVGLAISLSIIAKQYMASNPAPTPSPLVLAVR